jgi:hypothetical protein
MLGLQGVLEVFDDGCLLPDFDLVPNDFAKLDLALERFFLLVLLIEVGDGTDTLEDRRVPAHVGIQVVFTDEVTDALVKLWRGRLKAAMEEGLVFKHDELSETIILR